MKCSVEACEREVKEAGLCGLHYQRKRRHGDPLAGRRLNGTGTIRENGYIVQYKNGTRKSEHVIVAERALGRELPEGAEVHHVNEIKTDNRPENLVVCQDRNYHRLLHVRTRAYDACGHADWMKCWYCKTYSDQKEMRMVKKPPNISYMHLECSRVSQAEGRARRAVLK